MASSFPNKWAVLFGATKYQHVEPLKFCTQDVIEIGRVLRSRLGFPSDHILEFGDGLSCEPEYSPFWRNLGRFLKKSGIAEDDLLVFYFSGHGFCDGDSKDYLMPVDASLDALSETGIGVDLLIGRLRETGCSTVVTIFDACRNVMSGAKGLSGFGEESKSKSKSESLIERPGVLSFFSCDPTDRSWEIEDLKRTPSPTAWSKASMRARSRRPERCPNFSGVESLRSTRDTGCRPRCHGLPSYRMRRDICLCSAAWRRQSK